MPAKKTAATSKTPVKKPDTKATKAETNAKAAAKATAAKTAAAKSTAATAKAGAKPAAKAAAPVKRAVARPVTRVARPVAATSARPAGPQKREKRAKVEGKALPTAPQGHAPLISADGTPAGSMELPAVLATPGKRLATLFQMFIAGRANARQSNAHTKNRARVSGGGAKPWRQKGTGRARQGSTRSPQWRHGGVVFGPNGRQFDQRMPEKMRRAAFAEAMSAQAAAGRLFVVEDMKLDGERPRTRDAVTWFGNIGDTGSTVFVWSEIDDGAARAMANLPEIELRTPGSLRLSDVITADTLLVMRPALDALVARSRPVHAPAAEAVAAGAGSRG